MFVQSNFGLVYSVIMDAVMISLALHLWYKEQRFNFKRIWDWSVIDLLTQALYAVNIYGMLAVLWTNLREYKSLLEIFKKFSALEQSYFGKYQYLSPKCVKFHNYIIWKGLALFMNNFLYFTHVFTLLGRYQVLSVRVIFVQLYRMLLSTILLLLALHFYRHVLLIYRYMRTLTEHLKYLANYGMSNAQAYTRWHEINEIVRVYVRLQQLSREFTGIYGKQVFFGIVAITLDNAHNTIVLLLIWKSQTSVWYFTFIIYVIVINCIDFWLIIVACELAVNAARDLSLVLRCFNDTTQLDVEAEREVCCCYNFFIDCIDSVQLCVLRPVRYHYSDIKTKLKRIHKIKVMIANCSCVTSLTSHRYKKSVSLDYKKALFKVQDAFTHCC